MLVPVESLFSISDERKVKAKIIREIRAAFESINGVHLVPLSGLTPIVVGTDRDHFGRYFYHSGTRKPERIELSRLGDTPAFTLTHEIGHHIEKVLLPAAVSSDRQWDIDPLLGGWWAAMSASVEVRRLREIQRKGTVIVSRDDGTGDQRPISIAYLTYLLSGDELWARS